MTEVRIRFEGGPLRNRELVVPPGSYGSNGQPIPPATVAVPDEHGKTHLYMRTWQKANRLDDAWKYLPSGAPISGWTS